MPFRLFPSNAQTAVPEETFYQQAIKLAFHVAGLQGS